MVNDPRVSQTLARLGGVYKDPSRVDRDASSLLRSSVGSNLQPIAANHYEDDGTQATVLVLQGTIAMHYRGNTYQLLVDIYLAPGYPIRPPICFVRLAENMYIKENHKHVGSDGKVYLPYLHEWRTHTHNLIELVVAMSSVFSADPPVFTRSPTEVPPPPVSEPPPSFSSFFSSSMNSSTTTSSSWQQDQQRREQQRLEEQRREQQRLEDQRREQQIQQEERNQQLNAQRQWEQRRTKQVRDDVAKKIHAYVSSLSRQCQQELQNDLQDEQRLKDSIEKVIKPQIEAYESKLEELEKQCRVADRSIEDIQKWLEEAKSEPETETKATADDLVVPEQPLHAQMMELSAENASIKDALYFIDRALYRGHLTLDAHLRQVRRLAKRQFLVRAHLLKINQIVTQGASRM